MCIDQLEFVGVQCVMLYVIVKSYYYCVVWVIDDIVCVDLLVCGVQKVVFGCVGGGIDGKDCVDGQVGVDI